MCLSPLATRQVLEVKRDAGLFWSWIFTRIRGMIIKTVAWSKAVKGSLLPMTTYWSALLCEHGCTLEWFEVLCILVAGVCCRLKLTQALSAGSNLLTFFRMIHNMKPQHTSLRLIFYEDRSSDKGLKHRGGTTFFFLLWDYTSSACIAVKPGLLGTGNTYKQKQRYRFKTYFRRLLEAY